MPTQAHGTIARSAKLEYLARALLLLLLHLRIGVFLMLPRQRVYVAGMTCMYVHKRTRAIKFKKKDTCDLRTKEHLRVGRFFPVSH